MEYSKGSPAATVREARNETQRRYSIGLLEKPVARATKDGDFPKSIPWKPVRTGYGLPYDNS